MEKLTAPPGSRSCPVGIEARGAVAPLSFDA
jgi:hypothetical protein